MSLITLQKVSVVYGRFFRRRAIALDQVDFTLENDEFVSVVGPSGAGKSTFVQVCGGMLTPSAGAVSLMGRDIAKLTDMELSVLRNRSIGFVFQFFHLIQYLTAIDNVALPLALAGMDEYQRRQKAVRLLKRFGLGERLEHLPPELSGGECQRVGLARALAAEPRLIIADEPTGNLDQGNFEVVLEYLMNQRREHQTAILLVTHDQHLASFADRTVHIDKGRLQ